VNSEVVMLVVWAALAACYDLRPYVGAAWNMEIIHHNSSERSYYHFNLTAIEAKTKWAGDIYEGDIPPGGSFLTEKTESLGRIELKMMGGQMGILSMVKPYVAVLTEFEFVYTFTDFVGAYGTYNGTLTYSANLVNLAILHVNLFDFDRGIVTEVIITRYSRSQGEPWYERYASYLAGGGALVLTLVVLNYGRPLLHHLGFL
jgi:hypothetical protein